MRIVRVDEADGYEDDDFLLLLLAGGGAKEPRSYPWNVAEKRNAVVDLLLDGARKPANHRRRAARHGELGYEALNLDNGETGGNSTAVGIGLRARLDPSVLRRDRRDDRDADEAVGADSWRHVKRYAPAKERLLRKHELVLAGNRGHLHVEVEGVAAGGRRALSSNLDIRVLSRHVDSRLAPGRDNDLRVREYSRVLTALKRGQDDVHLGEVECAVEIRYVAVSAASQGRSGERIRRSAVFHRARVVLNTLPKPVLLDAAAERDRTPHAVEH